VDRDRRKASAVEKRRVARGRALALLLPAGALFLAWFLGSVSCRTQAPTAPEGAVALTLDAVPILLKADSTSVSSVWATVLENGQPVSDSTVVYFVASLGTIDSEALTKDGLARATYTPGSEPGVAAVIAQVKAVRDTVMITVY